VQQIDLNASNRAFALAYADQARHVLVAQRETNTARG
jgi:hypothetical protein